MGRAREARHQAVRQVSYLHRWHEPRARFLPQRSRGEALEPPLAPTCNRALWYIQCLGQFGDGCIDLVAFDGQHYDGQGDVNTSA